MRSVTRRLRPVSIAVVLALPLVSACTTRTVQPRSGATAAQEVAVLAPVLAVERFLQAVNAEDFETMAGLFGTAQGPFQGEPTEVELQMSIIAQILRHDDYEIATDRREPGRVNPTRRIGVNLTIGRRRIPDVSFLVVQTGAGNWMVEEMDLEKVTG